MRPLLFSVISFMCGIAAGDFFGLSFYGAALSACLFVLLSASFFYLRKHSVAFCLILFSIFSMGAAVIAYRVQVFSTSSALLNPDYYGKTVVIEGAVSGSPSFLSFTVSAENIFIDGEKQGFRAKAVVLNRTDFRGYDYGDYVRVRGVLRESFQPRSGAAFMLGVYSPSWIANLRPADVNPFMRFALSAGGRLEDVIEMTMPEPESLFLKSVLLGKRHALPEEIRHTLSGIGAGHFLSVSGLHAGLVLFFLMTMAGLAGFPRRQASLFCIAGLVLFCLMTGARVPTVRAVVLAVVVLFGTLLGRQVDRWNALALGALLILAFKPEELFLPGFQLSFAAVAGIFYLYPCFRGLWPGGGKLSFIRRPLLALASIHLAVIPLIGLLYGYVPAVSPVANLVLIPLLSVVVALGLCAGMLGVVHSFPAQVINAANWGLIRVVLEIAGVLYRVPGLISFSGLPAYSAVFYYAGLLALPYKLNKFLPLKKRAEYAEQA